MDLNSGVTVARAMIHGGELDAAQDLGSDWGWEVIMCELVPRRRLVSDTDPRHCPRTIHVYKIVYTRR